MPDYPHHHFKVPANRRELRFKGNGRGEFKRRTDLSREQHAARLQQQLANVQDQFEAEQLLREDSQFADDFALLLNIKSAPDYPLKLDSFESKPSKNNEGIYLLNVRTIETDAGLVMCAAISVPVGRLDVLVKKVAAFADPSKDLKSPRNADLLANIDSITVAALEALWMEPEPLPEKDALVWWELWVSRADRGGRSEQSWLDRFEVVRDTLGLETNRFRLSLPDNVVVMVKATRAQLESSLDLLNTLTEVHKVRLCSIDLPHLDKVEQHDWMQLALERIDWPEDSAPAVCILDTGVNRAHPLLERVLSEADVDTMIPQFGTADHPDPQDAHGTPMAGMATYDDLRGLMVLTTGRWVQSHRLESMKLIHSGDEHDAENYGAITNEAITRQESKRPDRARVYCMALTQLGVDVKGQPSAWSAGVDASAAGTNEEYAPKRVIFLSAGNHRDFLDYEYTVSNAASLIESPAQAWNGITVGAMTRRADILEGDDESLRSRAIAPSGGLCPFTRTSMNWDPRWPIKPDIVMEGGNLAITESGELVEKDSLLLVSTASNFLSKPLCNMNATSAATASASRLGAMLQAKFPDYWAETYRGLLVHSARWSETALGHYR